GAHGQQLNGADVDAIGGVDEFGGAVSVEAWIAAGQENGVVAEKCGRVAAASFAEVDGDGAEGIVGIENFRGGVATTAGEKDAAIGQHGGGVEVARGGEV